MGYVTAEGGQRFETLELSGAARFGDSGGPVLDRNHRLVAVLFGTNGRVVDATVCGRIHRFLAELVLRIRTRRANRLAPPKPPQERPLENPPLVDLTPVAPKESVVEPPPSAPANAPDTAVDRAPPKPPVVELPENLEPIGRAADSLANAAEPWISARLAAWLISIGVPGGVAGVAAGAAVWLVMRRGKKRLESRLSRLQDRLGGAPADESVAPQTIEPQMIERHHNRYVAYEVTALDKAWAAAHAQVGEKYPGAVPYLKIAESVKEQLLAGNSDSQPS